MQITFPGLAIVFLIVCAIATGGVAAATETSQNPPTAGKTVTADTPLKFEYAFDIGGEPGLPIIQDRDGFLWFTSFFNGLVRFDGSSKWMIREGEEGISNDFVTQVFQDADGVLWIGTNHGLNRYDKTDNTITRFFKDDANPESSLAGNTFNLSSQTIIQDRDGHLWFGTQSGLSRYDPASGRFSNYFHDPNDPTTLSDNDIYSLYQDRDGYIWVGTRSQGVNRFDPNTHTFKRFVGDLGEEGVWPAGTIRRVMEDRDGHLWIASREAGLIRRERGTGKLTVYQHDPDDPASLPAMEIWNIVPMNSGELAVIGHSASVGLVLMDPRSGYYRQQRRKPGDPYSLSTDTVQNVFEDRDGTLWVTHNNGKVDKLDPNAQRLTLYRHNPPG